MKWVARHSKSSSVKTPFQFYMTANVKIYIALNATAEASSFTFF
jgi:hypothetical protein